MASGSPKQLGVQHMVNSTDPAMWEPQRTNNFEVQICGLDDNDSEDILLSVATFSPPSTTISPIEVHYHNNSLKVAGKPTTSEATIVVNDYIGLDMQHKLQRWYNKTYDPKTQKIGLASEYKKSGTITEFAPNGTLPRSWTLKGVWMSDFKLGEYDQQGNAIRQLTATLQVDYCILDD